MTTVQPPRVHRVHPAWWVAAVTFLALIGAAAFRAVPGVLIQPLRDEFGWSLSTISLAVAINLALYGITAPFWFGFVGSAVLVAVMWRAFAHLAHDDLADDDPAERC